MNPSIGGSERFVHGEVAEGGEEGEDVREEVGGEPLDVPLIAVAQLQVLLHLSLSLSGKKKLIREACGLRGRAGCFSCSARTSPAARDDDACRRDATRREWTRAGAAWKLSRLRRGAGGMS
jgi:hypothetical protein